jgi:hypothetical protein
MIEKIKAKQLLDKDLAWIKTMQRLRVIKSAPSCAFYEFGVGFGKGTTPSDYFKMNDYTITIMLGRIMVIFFWGGKIKKYKDPIESDLYLKNFMEAAKATIKIAEEYNRPRIINFPPKGNEPA